MANNFECDWTHKNVKLKDIRKGYKFYTLMLDVQDEYGDDIITHVSHQVVEDILTSYFMKSVLHITREQILDLKWNIYLTKGYYIKIDKYSKEVARFDKENHPNKYFISYLDVNTPLVNTIFYNIDAPNERPADKE